jgi:hypothetical protein
MFIIVLPCLSNVTYNLQIILYIAAINAVLNTTIGSALSAFLDTKIGPLLQRPHACCIKFSVQAVSLIYHPVLDKPKYPLVN